MSEEESPKSTEMTTTGTVEVVEVRTSTENIETSAETQFEPGKTRKSFNGIDSAIKCMISFFTIIRLDVGQAEFDAMERNFWLVPVLGFINGLVAMLVCLILGLFGVSILVQAVAALVSMYVFSKFLHFDGLTDFGDGMIVSSGKREDHIRALKDSLIGAGGFGVALVVVLLTIACYAAIGEATYTINLNSSYDVHMIFGIGFVAFCVEILVKNAQVAAAAFGEPGNGMASRQVRQTDMDSLVRSTLVTIVALLIATLIGCGLASFADFKPDFPVIEIIVLFIVSVLLSIGTGVAMAKIANRNFGFVNGDILGATNEISRVVILLVALMLMGLW
ncbi:MAG: adenosylcobinamide-GDP ribazoletransferase [archaeon]|nr:adenosylcobinamide-GDP ribazoletransferase [archaeon]